MKVETIESEEKTVTGREGEAAFMSLTNFLYGFSNDILLPWPRAEFPIKFPLRFCLSSW
jgi:hypothetical protein